MNFFDIIVLIFICIAVIEGLRKGFIRQVFGLLALFVGVWAAYHYGYFAERLLSRWLQEASTALHILSIFVTFIVVLLLVELTGWLAERLIHLAQFGFADKLLGVVFAVSKWTLILVVTVFFLAKLGNVLDINVLKGVQNAWVYPFFEKIQNIVFPYLTGITQ